MTPVQARMARAGLKMSIRDVAALLPISTQSITLYEQGSDKVSVRIDRMLEEFYRGKGAFFGPAQSVCWDSDIFMEDRWFAKALFQLIKESGKLPSSSDLIAAGKRSDDEHFFDA